MRPLVLNWRKEEDMGMLQWVVRAGIFVLATTIVSNAPGKAETASPFPQLALSLA